MQKMATIIVMQDIFSDQTNQYVEVYELWHLKWVV